MQLKTILNRVAKQPGFVFNSIKLVGAVGALVIYVQLRARGGSLPICSGCLKKRKGYDRLPSRHFDFVPLWNIPVRFVYAPRRADCRRCGVLVELMPWSNGKSPITTTWAWFLASWAKVLSWTETARRFRTSWHVVFDAVRQAVEWGRAHQNLDGIQAIGVDELAWKKGHKYLTLVYQVDHGCKRLLWIGRDRTAATFGGFFDWLGDARSKAITFVISDMWRAFLGTVARRASAAVHVLDRFHVAKLFSKAIDKVRRGEVRKLRDRGDKVTLTKTRWVLLKRQHRLTDKQHGRLQELLQANLRTVRAYLLKESFHSFWGYLAPYWAGRFLDRWTTDALRSRIVPFATLARTLRKHRVELLNWIRARAKNAFAMGAVEGFNNKARVTTRMAYGFRTYKHAEIALFHRLGELPVSSWPAHRFV
jgi:transposase